MAFDQETWTVHFAVCDECGRRTRLELTDLDDEPHWWFNQDEGSEDCLCPGCAAKAGKVVEDVED